MGVPAALNNRVEVGEEQPNRPDFTSATQITHLDPDITGDKDTMTTKIITPADVTMEMLIAGIECNETAKNLPARYQLVNGEIRYSVKFTGEWEWVSSTAWKTATIEDVRDWMGDDTDADTIWTTTVEQETP